VVIGLDHGLQSGAMPGIERLHETARRCVEAGADALLVGPRAAPWIGQSLLNNPEEALLLRVDQTNAFDAPRPAGVYGTLVADAEDAVRVGADAVVIFYAHEGVGTAEERDGVARVARIASRARELGIPLVVEAIAPGGEGETCKDPQAVARVARVGFELGADVLKIDYPSDEAALKEIVEGVDVPVLVRGGPRTDDFGDLLSSIGRAMELGVRGVVLGRNVWQSGDPELAVKELIKVVHGRR
jgi:DhnA family fructose-bisphosphate aldolase class Ia